MRIEFSASSVVGRRSNNEDRFCGDEELGLFVVAAGMGGYEGGEIASRLTVDEVRDFVSRNRRDMGSTWPCGENKHRAFSENLLHAAAPLARTWVTAGCTCCGAESSARSPGIICYGRSSRRREAPASTATTALSMPSAKDACEAIVLQSFEAGSQDNITAVVVRLLA